MYKNQKVGKFGEDVAVKYLKQNGYKILDRNFSCKRGELDIVALQKKQIVFIEIKARTSIEYGLPKEAVTKKKLEHIYKIAEYYLYTRNLEKEDTRIDVIEVYIKNGNFRINHLKQVM